MFTFCHRKTILFWAFTSACHMLRSKFSLPGCLRFLLIIIANIIWDAAHGTFNSFFNLTIKKFIIRKSLPRANIQTKSTEILGGSICLICFFMYRLHFINESQKNGRKSPQWKKQTVYPNRNDNNENCKWNFFKYKIWI